MIRFTSSIPAARSNRSISHRLPRALSKRLLAQPALAFAVAAVAGAGFGVPLAHADVLTWVGNTSANLADANWTDTTTAITNTTPVSGDSWIFGVAGSAGTALSDNLTTGPSWIVAGITFNSGAPAYTVTPASSANSFTLTGNITNNSTSLQTIGDGIAISGSPTLTGNLTLSGNLSGTGAALIKTGSGVVTLSGTNTYDSGTTINGGWVIFANTNAVPTTGTITLAAGAIAQLNFSSSIPTFISHVGSTSAGVVALTASDSEALDFTNAGTTSLGSNGNAGVTYSGTLTPNNQTYRFGGGTNSNYLSSFTVSSTLGDVNSLPTNVVVSAPSTPSRVTVVLSGSNTYTGATTITNAGVNQLAATTIANGGLPSSIGESSNAAANLILNNGTLAYTGTVAGSTDRLFTIGSGGGTVQSNGSGAGATFNFTNTGAIAFSVPDVANTLILNTTSGKTLIFSPQVTDNGTSQTSLTYSGNDGAAQILNTDNTFTGAFNRSSERGVLTVTKLANGGLPSSIGASTNAAANLNFADGNTLNYIGSGDTTDRNMTVSYEEQYGVQFEIENTGTGALVMSGSQTTSVNNIQAGSAGVVGLVLAGTNPGTQVNQYNGTIADFTTPAAYNVVKTGTNTWSLGGTNTYTGTTIVNGGALLVTGSLASGSAVTVNGSAYVGPGYTGTLTAATASTLGGGGIIGGSVTVNTGGTLQTDFDAATPQTLTVGSLVLNSGSATTMDVAGLTSNDNVTVSTALAGITYGGTLNVNSINGFDISAQSGSYDLFAFTGDFTGDFSAVNIDGFALTDPFGVWTGTNNGDLYTFTDSTGILDVVAPSSVPEPASLALLAVGGMAMLRRRRRTR